MFKKILFSFFLFICSFSIVNAKDFVGSIYTSNEYRSVSNKGSINLFEEVNKKTVFGQYLFNHSTNFVKDIAIKTNDFDESMFYDENVSYSIYSYSDIFENQNMTLSIYGSDRSVECLLDNSDVSKCGYQLGYSVNLFDNYTDIYDIDYVIAVSGYSSSGSSNSSSLSISDDYFDFNNRHVSYLYYLNSNADLVGYVKFSDFYTADLHLVLPIIDKDMSSWYSYLFKFKTGSNTTTNWGFDKIYPKNFYLDSSKSVSLENNAGYSGLSGWLSNLFSKYVDVSSFNLNFIYNRVFYKSNESFKSMYYYWLDNESVSVPEGFSSISVSNDEKGYYLKPKNSCSKEDYYFYYSNTDSISVHSLYFNFYKYDSELSDLDLVGQYMMYSSTSYVPYLYNPFVDLDINANSDFSIYKDYLINIHQIGNFNNYTLYYNSSCYDKFDSNFSGDIAFNSGSYTFTKSKSDSFYSSDNINSNHYSGSFNSSKGSSNSSVVNSNTIPKVNPNDNDSSSNSFALALGDITNWVGGIFESLSALVGITAVFLNGLPDFILGAFQTIFILGLILILIKAIK